MMKWLESRRTRHRKAAESPEAENLAEVNREVKDPEAEQPAVKRQEKKRMVGRLSEQEVKDV